MRSGEGAVRNEELELDCEGAVLAAWSGRVLVITLNRPESRNAV